MSIELKIKSKHLGLEAKVIKHEEKKLRKQIRWSERQTIPPNIIEKYYSIHNHRVWNVRNENRATFLARAYLAGIPYKAVEQKRQNEAVFKFYILPRVFDMVNKYGPVKDRIYKGPVRYGNTVKMEYDKEQYDAFMQKLKDWSKLD